MVDPNRRKTKLNKESYTDKLCAEKMKLAEIQVTIKVM